MIENNFEHIDCNINPFIMMENNMEDGIFQLHPLINFEEFEILQSQFLKISNDVCRGMLDNKIYDHMLKTGVFSQIQNSEEISKGFNFQATEIFSSVFTSSHSFVTDFVMK